MRLKVQDLIPGTDYVLQVRAIVDGEKSRWSEKFEFTTTSNDSAPAVPEDVTFDSIGDTFVSTWSPVTENVAGEAVKIVSYELEYTSSESVTKTISVVAKTDSTNSYTLTKEQNMALFVFLSPSFTFRIRAVSNKDIKSDWSEPLEAGNLPPAAPENFEAVPGMMSIQLTWDAVEEDDIAGYSVWVGDHDGFTTTPTNLVYTGDATTFLYVSSTFVEQFFILRAFDTFGQYSEDATTSATPLDPFQVDITPPDLPVITSGSLSNNANGIGAVLSVAWTQATPDNDDLAGFWLRYRKVGTTNWEIAPYQAEDRAASLEVLYAYANYEVQLRSVDTFANPSDWTATYTVTSPSNTPPSNVTGLVSTAGKDSIIYQWNAVSDTDIKNYELTFSTSSTFASGNITYLTGNATVLNVGGLTYGTTYYARVRAVDQGGLTSTAWSATDTETTGTIALTDGSAPSSSPTPTVLSRFNSLYVTWSPISNADAVTYEVHLGTGSASFATSSSTKVTETAATSALINGLPVTNAALSYTGNYYVRIIAKDRDGAAAAGTGTGPTNPSKVVSTDVTSIGADLIVPGSGFIANLVVNTGGSMQSSNYSSGTSGWKISPTGAEYNDSGSSIKADAIKAGTLGGSGGSGVINIAAGTSLIFNGGYLKSNTNTGTTMATAVTSGAGFYLGNDGLFIGGGANGGQIKANALVSDTLTSTTITLGAGGSIVGGSWTLSSSGLSIPNGGIQAAMINITSGFGNSVTGASTTIDGGKINTGTIVSTANAVNIITGAALSPTQPAWSISTTGAAQFGNVLVLGRINVGSSSYGTSSGIQSYNYVAGSTGWKIDGSGNSEFVNGVYRGTLTTATSASTSQRIVIRDDGSGGIIESYSGLSTETASVFDPSAYLSRPTILIKTGTTPTYTESPFFKIYSGATGGSIAQVNASDVTMNLLNGRSNIGLHSSGILISSVDGVEIAGGTNPGNLGLTVDNNHVVFESLNNTSGIDNQASGTMYARVTAGGQLCSSTAAPSSRRLKKNIKYLRYDSDKILSLRPRQYEYKEIAGHRTGFIAEEADQLGLNLWVGYEDSKNPDRPTGFYYEDFVAAHQLVLREHHNEIKTLKQDNEELKDRLAALESAVSKLGS